MKKFCVIIFSILIFPNLCFATSLDEIYRDIVRSNNQGYLPVFVKNRHTPDFLDEDEFSKQIENEPAPKKDFDEPVDLNNQRKLRNDQIKKEIKAWKKNIDAIKKNQVSPLDLEEVEKRVSQNDPKATEIYAWMLARGVGINQDLNKALEMYQKAHFLKVPNAMQNAAQIYKSMTPEQREQVKSSIQENNS